MNRKFLNECMNGVIIVAGALGLFAGGLPGCMSAKNHPALESVEEAMKVQPYVEAYVEFLGPKDKWIGPASYLLHVSAKEGKYAQITMSPEWFNVPYNAVNQQKHLTTSGRAPASAIGMLNEFGKAAAEQEYMKAMSIEGARGRIQLLSEVMQRSGEQSYQGCMSPVRVRLIRADGGVFEKTGCRSDSGWTFAASEAVEYFMTAAIYGSTQDSVSIKKGAEGKPEARLDTGTSSTEL